MASTALASAPEALAALAASEAPFLCGVRHHSPACAAALPHLLASFAPEVLLLELPPELEPWLEWLGHPETQPPVALAAAGPAGGLSFYPFAEFSPELAALRWALAAGVPVEACDLPLRAEAAPGPSLRLEPQRPSEVGLLQRLLQRSEADDFEELWDRRVEAPAPGAAPESVRRAGLLLGWALRLDQALGEGIEPRDLAREAWMRARLAAHAGRRVAAVVGAFHTPALLPEPLLWSPPPAPLLEAREAPTTSLIPYATDLLDSRSGYPAGIRDPLWQQAVFEARDAEGVSEALATALVAICAHVRASGHPAGVPDAREALRLALDLAALRGLPAPARRELWEATEVALGQGERLGRGRVLARAGERVLVGSRRGRLAPDTPRSGLAPHVEGLLGELSLPGPGEREARDLRLDPQRKALDRRRQITLARLAACRVVYGEAQAVAGAGGSEALGTRWKVAWSPQTSASLELAGLAGVTLVQAARGTLVAARARDLREDRLTAERRLEGARLAASCGLSDLAHERLGELLGPFLSEASLPQLVEGANLLSAVLRGHEAGLLPPGAPGEGQPGAPDPFVPSSELAVAPLLQAAVAALDGLAGSEEEADAQALLGLVQSLRREGLSGSRLGWSLDRLAEAGAPLILGAAAAARALLGRASAAELGLQLASWLDLREASVLAGRLRGALIVAAPLLEADPELSAPLRARVAELSDEVFLRRLPGLREGFQVLSPEARQRLLDALVSEHGLAPQLGRDLAQLELDPERLARFAAADQAGLAALEALGLAPAPLDLPQPRPEPQPEQEPDPRAEPASTGPPLAIGVQDRWRLILGRKRPRSAQGQRAARALDELYGRGSEDAGGGPGGGQEEGFPTAREWAQELEALFGEAVREEVLGRAVEQGWAAAAFELDPEQVRPSVGLLQNLLALRGGLPESRLGELRRLVGRVVEQLVDALAVRLQPALSGLATRRPTRRPGGPLDLERTVRRNLHTVRSREDGTPQLAPERWTFRERAKPSLDWRLILVVDVSGSMEPSVIYSALVAAILARVPTLSVSFLAFNTEVIDLSEHVSDPLALLLEVSVGGGTSIGRALRAARQRLSVPARSLVVCVSDFEEGGSVPRLIAEVRALVETGATALGLAALDDLGQPRYSQVTAERVVAAGMPVAALTPLELARWVGEQVRS